MSLTDMTDDAFLNLTEEYVEHQAIHHHLQNQFDELDGVFPQFVNELYEMEAFGAGVPTNNFYAPYFVYQMGGGREHEIRYLTNGMNVGHTGYMPPEMGQIHTQIDEALNDNDTDHTFLNEFGLTEDQAALLNRRIQVETNERSEVGLPAYYTMEDTRTPAQRPNYEENVRQLREADLLIGDEDPHNLLSGDNRLLGFTTNRADMEEYLQAIQQNLGDIQRARDKILGNLGKKMPVSFVDDMNLPFVDAEDLVAVPQDLESIPALEK